MKRKILIAFAIFLPIQIMFLQFLKTQPQWVELYYSQGIYPYLSSLLRLAFGFIPFSVGDVLYGVLIFISLRWIYKRIRNKFRAFSKWAVELLAFFSILIFFFHLFWGYNFYRQPLHHSLQLKADYNLPELNNYTEHLIEKTNKLQLQLTQNENKPVEFSFHKFEVGRLMTEGYHHLAKTNANFIYENPSIKPSLLSIPLSYMGFNGYLNPLTNEAQVNTRIPLFKLPTTTSHEIGHQIGYAKENEANFMACKVSMNHSNAAIRFAGYAFALQYCLGDLMQKDPCQADNLIGLLNTGVLQNYQEVGDFWQAHQNPLEPLFKSFYNQFLKANNQPLGMKSYNYVVALLVNDFYQTKTLATY